MNLDQANHIIQDTFDSLHRVGLLDAPVQVNSGTVVLGAGSPLDSIGFVTFITELEDRLVQGTGNPDIALVLDDVHQFNADEKALTTGTVARYAVHLAGQSETTLHG